jgi:hypothetical protein
LPEPRKKADFVFFDAGGGHRSAALALKMVMDAQERNWEIRLVNLQEVLDPLDIFRRATGLRMQDVYNLVLAKGWTLGSEYLLPLMHAMIRLYHRSQVKLLTPFWRERQPDLVVSLVPNFNRALFQSLKAGHPEAGLVTILTDFADHPPHFWIEKQPQYFICGTRRAAEQARGMGHPAERIFQVSGMILRPGFYNLLPVDKEGERRKLNLAADIPTGLVLFGAQGSPQMLRIAEQVGNLALPVQLIAVCGHNAQLRRDLEKLRPRNRLHVVGFTHEIPRYMQLSDFFIGKPGPGSLSEALHMRLPVIVEENSWTLPQERYNARWVQENQVGLVLKNFRQIGRAVEQLLARDTLLAMRERAAGLKNRAVFEIADILAELAFSTVDENRVSSGKLA